VRHSTIISGSVELKELYGRKSELVLLNGIIMHKVGDVTTLYVPSSKRAEVLEAAHNVAHQSTLKMLAALKERFWWPTLRRDITRHVATCTNCLRTRATSKQPHAALQLFPAAARFELVHIDVMGGRSSLPVTHHSNKYILTIVDHFTRYCVAVPMADQKAETVADAFVTHWVWRFGAPMRLHSDQGANFESTLFAEMCQRLHIAKSRTLSYHPQSNGAVERVNRTLTALLRALSSDKPKSWDHYLPQALFAYNTTPHRSTGVSPYLLVHGDEARLPVELIIGSPTESQALTDFVRQLVRRTAIASENARLVSNRAQSLAKDYYDANVHTRLY
jgi:transposase InsO family protein